MIALIRRYLKAGGMVGDEYRETGIGVPQRGNLPPLLANIMLNELDHANTRKGCRRSADSLIVKPVISKDRLEKAGYTFFLDDYLKVTA